MASEGFVNFIGVNRKSDLTLELEDLAGRFDRCIILENPQERVERIKDTARRLSSFF